MSILTLLLLQREQGKFNAHPTLDSCSQNSQIVVNKNADQLCNNVSPSPCFSASGVDKTNGNFTCILLTIACLQFNPGVGLCMQVLFYLLSNWLAYIYWRIESPSPDLISDRREGIMRAAGFGFARIGTQAS